MFRSVSSLLSDVRIMAINVGFGVALVGCGSSSLLLDGDTTTAQFALRLSSSANATALTIGDGLEVTTATVTVESIELWLPEGRGCEDQDDHRSLDDRGDCEKGQGESEVEDKIKIAGPFVFDLITGESTPPLSDFQIPSGTYKRIRLKAAEEVSPTIHVVATVAEGVVVETSLNSDEEIDIEPAGGLIVQEGSINAIVAEVDLSTVFAQFDLPACGLGGNLHEAAPGSYLVNGDYPAGGICAGYEEALEEAIFQESRVSCDHDEDESEEDESEED
jgi:hypothetical protein